MQYLILLVIFYFLMRKLFQVIGDVNWSLRTYRPAQLTWKQSGLFAGAIGVIVVVEMVSPSLRMTGLVRTTDVPLPDPLSQMPFADAPITYGEMASAAPFLWRMGTITRDEMHARLGEDIVLAQARYEKLAKESGFPHSARVGQLSSYLSRQSRQQLIRWDAMVKGLAAAQANLEARFKDEPIPSWEADRYVIGHVEAMLDARKVGIEEEDRQIQIEINQREIGLSDAEKRLDPELKKLRRERSSTTDDLLALHFARDPLRSIRSALPKDLGTPRTNRSFPAYPHPMVITSETVSMTLRDERSVTAPRPANGPRIYAQMSDAVTGRLRHSGRGKIQKDCALAVREKVLEPFCVVSKPLEINYDVTGTDCAAPDADGLCVERWVYPHLSVRFAQGEITLYPPRPKGGAGPSTLSQWSVTWQGQTRPLDVPVTLLWSGEANDLKDLRLTHTPRPDLQTPGIWQEFRPHYPGDDLAARAAAPPHPFSEQQVTGFVHPFGDFRGFLGLGAAQAEALYVPSSNLKTRKERLVRFSRDLRRENDPVSSARAFCQSGFDRDTFSPSLQLDAMLKEYIAATPADTCIAYHGYIAVLRALLVQQEEGRWLWLASDNYRSF